ncbi:Zn-dependent protease with chaperone function [Actinoplanes tereljensis]|uniref:Peptidase M48 domain-containing protein n=1 Tax=Paractinoplanes tereljensis TaxID=571912 RepID=A0A919NRN5_9ACTN|nr:M48 family metalloprotease [Actinoplanes tereljensis]GIF23068.1 hypothetical protein Ate02nite_57980 [Actinoplanes tereljensis]
MRQLRRALGDAAPTTLSTRFLVFFVLILAATVSIYGYLGLRLGTSADSYATDCLADTGLDRLTRIEPAGIPGMIGSTTPVVACVGADMDVVIWSGVAGLLLLGTAAFAAYRLAPRWRRGRAPRALTPKTWRVRLRPLAEYDPEAAAEVERLAHGFGLPAPPDLLTDPLGGSSFVFGSPRRPIFFLAGKTVRERQRDPDRFTAVVLHELAHLKNRDTRPSLLASTAWFSFLAVAVTPYLVLLVVDLATPDPGGWRPAAMAAGRDDLHTTLAILTLVTLVVLTRFAVLRDRELTADATAGAHDDGGALLRHLTAASEPPTRMPVFLRRHPPLSLRRRAAADPWAVPPVSFAQLVMAGAGLSALSQDAGSTAWHALIAAGFDPQPSPRTSLILVTAVAVAVAGPLAALAWLIEATTWRARLRQLVEPTRSPALRLALALGGGMLLGEAGSVSAANASHWGVFDGVGDGNPGTAIASASALVAVVLALCRWSWDNAGAWLPTVRRSLRRVSHLSAVAGVAAVLPLYATWWSMHDEPLAGRVYLWTPGLAEALKFPYVPFPAGQWLQIVYVPLDSVALTPGIALLVVLPLLVTTAGLIRRPVDGTPRWLTDLAPVEFRLPDNRPPIRRAIRAGAAGCVIFLLAGVALALAGRAVLPRAALNTPADTAFLGYLLATATVLAIVVSAGTAAGTVLRRGSGDVVFGSIAALVVACFGAAVTPLLMILARCGPGLSDCGLHQPVRAYLVFLSLSGTALPVKAVAAGMVVAGLAVAADRRSRDTATITPRPPVTLAGIGIALSGTVLAAAALASLSP